MKRQKIQRLNVLCCFLLMPSFHAVAQTNEIKNEFTVGLVANSELNDNANKKQLEEEKLEERKDRYGLGIDAGYKNDWVQLGAGYDASKFVYGEQSQPDYSMVEGETNLTLGNPYQPLSVLFTHSRRALLNAPDAEDATINLDQRDIIMVQPIAKWKATSADIVMFKASAADVSYREAQSTQIAIPDAGIKQSKDSERLGAELAWVRGISKTDQFQVAIQSSKTIFDTAAASNYEYQNVGALYSVQLRQLSYTVQVGGNRAKPEVSAVAYSRPSYEVTSRYLSGNNTFKLNVSQRITDSSSGNNNSTSVTGAGSSSTGVGLDLINLLIAELAWSSKLLCERCETGVHVISSEEDYQLLNEDNVEQGVGGSFRYDFTRATSLRLSADQKKRTFKNFGSRENVVTNRARLSFDYRFLNELNVKVYLEQKERKVDSAVRSYDEQIIGLDFAYSF